MFVDHSPWAYDKYVGYSSTIIINHTFLHIGKANDVVESVSLYTHTHKHRMHNATGDFPKPTIELIESLNGHQIDLQNERFSEF